MHTLFARFFLRRQFAVAAVFLCAVGACEREAPTGLTLEDAVEFDGGFCGCPLTPSPPATPNGQFAVTGMVGQPVTISLAAIDRKGHTAPGVLVSWAVMRGGGAIDVASSTTDTSGIASVTWTLDTIAKTDSLRASIASGATMLVTATAQHGKAVLGAKVSGDSQTVALGGMSAPLVVAVADRYGNPVSGVAVAWVVTGGGTLSAITTKTDTSGMTQVTLSADPNAPGAHQVIATYGFARASTFTLTAVNATTPANQTKRIRVVTHVIP